VLRDQIAVEDFGHVPEELVQQHHVRQFQLQVKTLHQECNMLEVDDVGEVAPHSDAKLEDVFGKHHPFLAVLSRHSALLINDSPHVGGHQSHWVDGIVLAL